MGEAGNNAFTAIYTHADTDNYNAVQVQLTVAVHAGTAGPGTPSQGAPETSEGAPSAGDSDKLTGSEIAGIAIGVIAGVILIAYGVGAILFKKKIVKGAFFEKIYPFIK